MKGISWGTVTIELLMPTKMMFWRMKLTPMAVIRGASRGALRRRRYATRSMTTPTMPITTIDTRKTNARTMASSRTGR